MPYQIKLLEGEHILETIYRKQVKVLDVGAALQKNFQLAKKHQVNLFLVDCLEMIDTKTMVVENYETGILLRKLIKQIPRRVKIALILSRSQAARDNLLFFETVSRNGGVDLRTFQNRQDAWAWLRREDTVPL